MEYTTPKSTCRLCGKEFAGRGMARHIASCLKKTAEQSDEKNLRRHHCLRITAPYEPGYFLYLLMPESATLKQLDRYLRKTWLECCGHMSAFSRTENGGNIGMQRKIGATLPPGSKLYHQYDFGSTTTLLVKGMDFIHYTPNKRQNVNLLARNAPPIIPCEGCRDQPAAYVCMECKIGDGGFLCAGCADRNKCDAEMRLPVVNSPRTGVCAYAGE
jgi:hypothetical protein